MIIARMGRQRGAGREIGQPPPEAARLRYFRVPKDAQAEPSAVLNGTPSGTFLAWNIILTILQMV